jgi:hypothetical protein
LGGVLAESPRQFALQSGRRHPDGPEFFTAATSQNFSITNKGLHITTELKEYPPVANIFKYGEVAPYCQYVLPLDAIFTEGKELVVTGIYLSRLSASVFARVLDPISHWLLFIS